MTTRSSSPDGAHDQIADLGADLARVAVEERRDHETSRPQAVVLGDRRSQVSGADDRDALHVVGAEDVLDAVGEQLDVVADSALAELAEVREIAADLSGVDLGHLGEPRRGDRLTAVFAQVEQRVEIGGQTLDDAVGNARIVGGCGHGRDPESSSAG